MNQVWLHYAKVILNTIKQQGIRTERTPQAVIKKIEDLEKMWRDTHHWCGQTGQGVLEDMVEKLGKSKGNLTSKS